MLEFSKTSGMPILPISKITDYLREKTEEKIELENQIEDLKQEIQELNSEGLLPRNFATMPCNNKK